MYALHVYQGGSTTAQLIISSSLAALKAVRVPRLELLGALIGLRPARHVCSTLKMPTRGATSRMDNLDVGY